ncbi:Hypothetical protein A7982_03134 [Minicystis rosea]|nr:Hypothetical protein A7982_03134 [Minicystis rosea]
MVAAVSTASSVARADVSDQTWSKLQGGDVIVETKSGSLIGGKLFDVHPSSVALLLPSGESLTLDRTNVRSARATKGEALPAYPQPSDTPPPREPPKQIAPGVLEWREGDEIRIGYRKTTTSRGWFIVAGSIVFGTAWVPMAVLGVMLHPTLAIPVAGPIIDVVPHGGGGALYVLDGAQQAVGLGLIIFGLAARRTVLERGPVVATKTWWMPTPMSFGNGGMGLGIVGTM